jgi:LacI family transcriptional regulator
VTVRAIADFAGVSISSVSSVLNNRHVERRITVETVEKVRAAAAKLGYLPNISARRLRSGTADKDNVILALVTSAEAPLTLVNYFLFALRHALMPGNDFLEGRTCSLMIEMFTAGRLRDLPGLLTGDHFNAAIITNTTVEDDMFLSRTHLPYPVVLVNRVVSGYSSVAEEPFSGTLAADVLCRAKRNRLAVLHGKPLTVSTQARVDGFVKRVGELLGHPPVEIAAENLSESAARAATDAFLRTGEKIDGLFGVNDGMALGGYHAIKRRGLSIPADIAVVGVGDYDISPFFDPPLTAVGASQQELAENCVAMIARQLAQPGRRHFEQMTIPVKTVLRESTGHQQ